MSDLNTIEKPDWLEGHTASVLAEPPASAKRGNPHWKAGCKSPNPNGRPVGIVDKRHQLYKRMVNEADDIVRVVIEKALEGDTSAASLIISRILPALRNQSERVQFDFDPTASITKQVEQVLAAISSGEVSPDVGKQIIEAIGSLSAMRATAELEERIIVLEGRQL